MPLSSAVPPRNRNVAIAGGVVLLHVAVLWALQSGLLRRTVEVLVPVAILTELLPEAAKVSPPPPAPPPPPPVKVEPRPKPTPRPLPAAPQPVARIDPAPSPNAPTGVATPQPPAPPIAAPVAPTPAAPAPAPAPPAPPRVELPSTNADYLQNPKPTYPPISKRLGEQGKVVVRVLIGTDGTAQRGQIEVSSGYDRLDAAALATALKWRYVPGKRAGVPEAMEYRVPINFVLE